MRECIVLAACGANEVIPQHWDLPADIFTAALTTPIKVALRWFVSRSRLRMDGVSKARGAFCCAAAGGAAPPPAPLPRRAGGPLSLRCSPLSHPLSRLPCPLCLQHPHLRPPPSLSLSPHNP